MNTLIKIAMFTVLFAINSSDLIQTATFAETFVYQDPIHIVAIYQTIDNEQLDVTSLFNVEPDELRTNKTGDLCNIRFYRNREVTKIEGAEAEEPEAFKNVRVAYDGLPFKYIILDRAGFSTVRADIDENGYIYVTLDPGDYVISAYDENDNEVTVTQGANITVTQTETLETFVISTDPE